MYAILIIDVFSSKEGSRTLIDNFLKDSKSISERCEGVETISSNSWLLDLNKTIHSLNEFLDLAHGYKMSYKISLSEIKPKFIS